MKKNLFKYFTLKKIFYNSFSKKVLWLFIYWILTDCQQLKNLHPLPAAPNQNINTGQVSDEPLSLENKRQKQNSNKSKELLKAQEKENKLDKPKEKIKEKNYQLRRLERIVKKILLNTEGEGVRISDAKKPWWKFSFNRSPSPLYELLEEIVIFGAPDLLKKFLKKLNININQKFEYGSLLHIALDNTLGYAAEMTKILLEAGVDPRIKNCYRYQPLHLAAYEGRMKAVEYLLSNLWVDPAEKGKDQDTPLILAALKGHTRVMKLLINKNPNMINDVDKHGLSALHHAVINGHKDAVALLTEYSILDVNIRDKSGHTALYYAAKGNHLEIAKLLIDKYKEGKESIDIDTSSLPWHEGPLHIAIKNRNIKMIKILLSHPNIDVNEPGIYQERPLHIACKKGLLMSVQLLIKRGADPHLGQRFFFFKGSKPIRYAKANNIKEFLKKCMDEPNYGRKNKGLVSK